MYHSKDIYVKSQETFNTFTVYKTIKTARSQRHSRSLNDKFYLLFRTLCRAGEFINFIDMIIKPVKRIMMFVKIIYPIHRIV